MSHLCLEGRFSSWIYGKTRLRRGPGELRLPNKQRALKRAGKKITKNCAVMGRDLSSDCAVFSGVYFEKPLFIQQISECFREIPSSGSRNCLSNGWCSPPREGKISPSKTNKTSILWDRAERFPLMQESGIKFPAWQHTGGQERCL